MYEFRELLLPFGGENRWNRQCVTIDHFSRLRVGSLLVSYGDSNVWPGGLLQATLFYRYLGAKAKTRDLQDHNPTLWRLHLPNSMLIDTRCTYVLWIYTPIDIAAATNHGKPYQILMIMQQKLSNYTFCGSIHPLTSQQ